MLLSFASKLLMHTPSKFTEITVKVGLEFGKSSPLKHNIVCLSYAPCPIFSQIGSQNWKNPYWQKNILIEKIEPLDFALLLAWIMVLRAWRILPSILRRSEPRRHSKSLRRPRRQCQAWPYLIQITHTSSNQNYMTEIKDIFKIVATLLQFVTGVTLLNLTRDNSKSW